MLNLKTKVDLIYFTVSKIPSFLNIQTFCINNQPKIFGILCIIYAFFLCCITTPVIAAIILFWSGFLFTMVYMLNVIKVPLFQTVLGLTFFFRSIHIIKTEDLRLSLCGWVTFILVFLYFHFENNLLLIKLKEKFTKLKEARLLLANSIVTEFKYFGAVSTLASSILSVLVLFSLFIKKNFLFYIII